MALLYNLKFVITSTKELHPLQRTFTDVTMITLLYTARRHLFKADLFQHSLNVFVIV